jgi:hypothetical protein
VTTVHPNGVPAHLPPRLTITLWDFSWYTQATAGEPFHDLDAAFIEAVERGYNTVRICAMPYLLFGDHGIDTSALRFTSMGGEVGRRTRWYDVAGGAVLDGRRRLLELFEAARRRDCYVILSSWEYQQSPAFLHGREWYDALVSIPPSDRHVTIARAMADLAQWADRHGVPAVIGEGWVGYTPLLAEFEDGPVGHGLAEHALARCMQHGFWGVVRGSNSAPHHPGWRNVEWQRRWTGRFLSSQGMDRLARPGTGQEAALPCGAPANVSGTRNGEIWR